MFVDRDAGRSILEADAWDPCLCAYGILRDVRVDFIGKHHLDLDPDVATLFQASGGPARRGAPRPRRCRDRPRVGLARLDHALGRPL